MKKFVLTLLMTAALAAAFAHPGRAALDALWDEANTAYVNADYRTALSRYDSIYRQGYAGHRLFYNMGNTHFKLGNIGKSILFYNRALLINPADSDTEYNLAIANAFVKDKIDPIPEFILSRWLREVRLSLGSNAWATISLVLAAITVCGALLYLLGQRLAVRKGGFWMMCLSLVLFLFALAFASAGRRAQLDSREAVIMQPSVAVKSSPDNSSKELFVLHEGTRIEIVGSLQGWNEILLANGYKGWVPEAAIETIR